MSAVLVLVCLLGAYAAMLWWLWRDDPHRRQPAAQKVHESVLFVCTHNSARSQMAEALLRHAAGWRFRVASAGTAPTRVNPLAKQVMAERGSSLHSHRAKGLDEVGTRWDYVITLCEAAYEQCSEFPAKTCRLHWSVEDPSRGTGPGAQQLEAFRRVRDNLAERITQWVADRPETL